MPHRSARGPVTSVPQTRRPSSADERVNVEVVPSSQVTGTRRVVAVLGRGSPQLG